MTRARRFVAAAAAGALFSSGLVWAAAPSFAVHDTGMFELDGNIVHDGTATYDWGNLFGATGNRLVAPDPNNGPLLASGFVSDLAAGDTSYFKNGTKIGDPISKWACAPPSANDKTTINYTYAALVQIPTTLLNGLPRDNAGHTVLYLGVEKPAAGQGGDNAFGFWLFKNSGVGCSGTGAFTGAHTDGDYFIDGSFTNGGNTSDVQVFRWTGNDATGSLGTTPVLTGAVCGGATHDDACAIANDASITGGPWNSTGTNAANTFVEAGIDITALLGTAGGCFTSFLADSQTSQELVSDPKDYASGQFNTCPQPPLTTTATPGGSLVAPGAAQHDVANLSAVGTRPTPTGTVDFFLCGPIDVTVDRCPSAGTQIGVTVAADGSATSASASGATDTALGKYCWRAEYTPDAASSGKYLATSETNALSDGQPGSECFTVVHGSPTITTQIAVTGNHPGALGLTTLGDTATLHDFVGTVTGETVTFHLYGPFADNVTPVCTGTAVHTTTGTLSAGGVATASTTFDPTSAGTYVWTASYPGDTLNDPITDVCNQETEKTTVVGAVIDVAKSANPVGPVSAGDTIGFDITVTNAGSVPALGTTVTDTLPAGNGGDLNWSLHPSYTGCSISVGPPQVLTCDLGTVNHGSLPVIHVESATTPADCGVVSNKASVTTTNGTGGDSDVATVTVNCAALSLIKTADAPLVSAGSDIGFTVTASNSSAAGTGTAHGVVISDPLPTGSGVVWSIDSQTALACFITGAAPNVETVTCNIGDLAPGTSYSVHVTSHTVYASCADYKNTATLSATNASSIEKSATTTVQCPSVTLVKSADVTSVDAGSTIGFTIKTHNSGAGDATGVVVSDPLPTGTGVTWTIASAVGPLSCGILSGVLSCTGNLPAGATETVHITSPTVFASCGKYDNTASETLTNGPAPADASASVTVHCAALTLEKKADAPIVDAGGQIGFTVTVTNSSDAGTGTAHNVVINDPLPAGTGISWSLASGSANCSVTGSAPIQALVCTVANLALGGSFTAHVVSGTAYASCATYPNLATLTAENSPTIHANASTTVQCPSLTIIKTADHDTVSAGSSIGFTIDVGNAGPGTATAATLHDVLPAGSGIIWSIAPAYGGPGTCAITGAVGSQVLDCAFGDLVSGAPASVHITSTTVFLSCATYENTATVDAANAPPLESAVASTTVQCPDVSIVKTADAATVDAGANIGFTVTASNSSAAGTGTATGVVISDPLPTGSGVDWSIDSQTASACTITGASPNVETVTCNIGNLAPGASYSVHVTSGTGFASCGTYDNSATLTLTNGPTPAPATASTAVQCSTLTLSKTADSAEVNSGSAIGFTIAATNPGPGTATVAVLIDELPAGGGVDWSIDPAYTGPGSCAITGAVPSQTLVCELGDLAAGATASVHVVSATSAASCIDYPNTATLGADNAPSLTADASTTVICAAIEAQPPIERVVPPQVAPPQVAPLAATGAGPITDEIGWAIGLVVLGGLLLAATRRRRVN